MLMNEMPTAHLPTTKLTEQLMGSCIRILRRGSRRALGSRLLLKGWDTNTFPPPRVESCRSKRVCNCIGFVVDVVLVF
jgi:hypothetical protein